MPAACPPVVSGPMTWLFTMFKLRKKVLKSPTSVANRAEKPALILLVHLVGSCYEYDVYIIEVGQSLGLPLLRP